MVIAMVRVVLQIACHEVH